MSININSVKECYDAWYNVKYEGNTKNITDDEFKQIEIRWSANLKTWKSKAK